MKPVSLLVLLSALALAGCGSDSAASDDIVARVNGTEITAVELEKQFQSRVTGAEQPPAPEEAEDLKLQLLSQMINDQILLEMASEGGLSATDAEVDVRFNEFKGQYTEEQFQEVLTQQKMTADDIRAELRKQLTVEKLINKEITSKITVSEQEIKDFYEKNRESFNLPEGHHVAHILVTPVAEPGQTNAKSDDAKTPEEATAKAQRLLREIQGGIDFAIIARDYSEDPQSSQAGGDLSFQPLDALNAIDPAFAQSVQRLRVGETSGVVRTPFGFHIIKLIERDAGGQKDLTDPRVHAQVRQVIFNRKDQTLKTAFSETVRNKAEVNNYLAERVLASAGGTPVAE